MKSVNFKSKRRLIRKKIAEKLNPIVQGRVFMSRIYPVDQSALPGLTVFINRDVANLEYMTMGSQRWHDLSLTVQVHVAGNNPIDEAIDELEREVCQCLTSDPTLDGLVMNLRWLSTEISLSGEGVKPVGIADLSFMLTFRE